MKDEALKLALEALELSSVTVDSFGVQRKTQEAITAIKQAIAAPVQDLPFGVSGGLVAIKTLLGRDPCAHANTAIEMIDAILKVHPAAPDYAWPTVADYEKEVGFEVNDAFKAGWNMARTTNDLFTQKEKNT